MLRQTQGMSGLSVLGVDSSSSLEDLTLGSTSAGEPTLYQLILTLILGDITLPVPGTLGEVIGKKGEHSQLV